VPPTIAYDLTQFGQPISATLAPPAAFDDMATIIVDAPQPHGADDGRPMTRKSLPPGCVVHRYRIDNVIGEGGFGITYAAEDTTIRRRVALKELFLNQACYRTHANEVHVTRPDRDDGLMRWARFYFSEEARITFALRHEGIVRIHDFFRTNNTAYIVYEMLDGSDLQGWGATARPGLGHGEVLDLLRSTCEAIDHVHASGFVHRDLKPANIFVAGTRHKPVLIDFGAAIEKGAGKGGGEIVVTPGFSPPEKYRSDTAQDARADIYALCATFYWLLSGRIPPEAPQRLASDSLQPLPTAVDPPFRFGDRLYRVIGHGLSLDPLQRYDSVARLLDDLLPKTTLAATGYAPKPRGDKIFLSYRRDDSAHFTGRLLDFLEMRFGAGSVFFDAQSIPPGMDFWDYIKDVLSGCAIQLVVIGPEWIHMLRKRRRRWYQLAAAKDYVAQEIAAARELQVPVLPVLFDGATMPGRGDLPPALRLLPSLNASFVGSPTAFRAAVDGICDHIARLRSGPS
jgi:serine/threonine protein kinase